jgi:hypothetical protein
LIRMHVAMTSIISIVTLSIPDTQLQTPNPKLQTPNHSQTLTILPTPNL